MVARLSEKYQEEKSLLDALLPKTSTKYSSPAWQPSLISRLNYRDDNVTSYYGVILSCGVVLIPQPLHLSGSLNYCWLYSAIVNNSYATNR